MVIIPYKPEHKQRLLEIFALNTPTYYASEEKGDFLAFLSDIYNRYFTIKSMGEIAGGGGYIIDNSSGRLIWNMIDPDFRGMGLGRALLNHCLEDMRQKGNIRSFEVWTSGHARKFYEKFGFNVKDERLNFKNLGHDLYKMQRPA